MTIAVLNPLLFPAPEAFPPLFADEISYSSGSSRFSIGRLYVRASAGQTKRRRIGAADWIALRYFRRNASAVEEIKPRAKRNVVTTPEQHVDDL